MEKKQETPIPKKRKIITLRKNGSKRVQTYNDDSISMTDQSIAPETDVNYIVNKFMKTGTVTHLSNRQGQYLDATTFPKDLGEALNAITRANQAFMELPAQIREKFGNSPEMYISFLQDPKNDQEAVKLGLKERIVPNIQEQTLSEIKELNKNLKTEQKKKSQE